MKPIPKELNLDRIIGQQLQQICIGAHDLQFRFEQDNQIRCQGTVTVTTNNTRYDIFTEKGWNHVTQLSLLAGREVRSWKVEDAHVLSITLDPLAVIHFISEDSPYEDFIVDPEETIW